MLTKKTTLYDLFGVEPDAPVQKIRALYRLRTLQTHPREPGSGNEELQKELNRAYAILKDPLTRRAYNQQLGLPLDPRPLKPGTPIYEEVQVAKSSRSTVEAHFTFSRWEPCDRCWGEGCPRCQGSGQRHIPVTLTATIPTNVSQVLIENQGARAEPGGSRGDLILYVIWHEEQEGMQKNS